MLQVFQNPKTGKTNVEEITPPVLRPGGVLVRNRYSVVSAGTERGIIELSKKGMLAKARERPDYVQKFFMLMKTKGPLAAWRVAQSKLATSIALGYSSAGRVTAVGEGVDEFKVGDRVACAGQNYASHAEVVFVPKNLCVKIPRGVDEREAAFGTLGAIALQGIRRAELSPGERVALVGLGLLGQLAARILKAYGHPVMGFDIDARQVEFARANGIDGDVVIGKGNLEGAVRKFTGGKGFDAVLIYASAKTDEPLRLATAIARDRGRVVQVGNIETRIPWRDFYAKELQFFSSRSYGPGRYDPTYEEKGVDYPIGYVRWTEKRNVEEFLRLIADRRISVANLVTKTFDIADAVRAYELVFRPKGLIHGLVLSYPEGRAAEETLTFSPAPSPSLGKQGTVRIGLIGLGSFMTSTILPHLKEVEGVSVRAICDPKGLPASEVAKKWGAAYATADYRKLLDDRDIDLIVCATRHRSHAAIAEETLKADKNLYIEKPLAVNEAELRRVITAARRSRGRLMVGFNRRFSRHFLEAREEFKDAATPLAILYRVNAGPLEPANWTYAPEEGGRLIGEGCHFVDALQFLAGSRPRRLAALGVPAGGAVPHEENFTLTIEYENGSLGTILFTALGNFRHPKEYLEIYGDGKVMTIDNFKSGRVIYPRGSRRVSLWRQDKGYTRELEAIVRAIREGKPSPISLDDLFLSHLTTMKAAEALRTGEAVTFA